MRRIALKIDADTYHGTRSGVPVLLEALQRHGVSGSFFFSLGPDQSGTEKRHSSLSQHYDLSTRLFGRILPSPTIANRCADLMKQTQDLGFEVGIHAWNRVKWEQSIQKAKNPWVEAELTKACVRFSEVFPGTSLVHAAAGWRMNRHALRLTQRLGFSYASDSRGSQPYIPVIDGEIVVCAQLPTTLPTLDEILGMEPGFSPEQAVDRILQLSCAIPGDHVFTLRAELEGLKFREAFDRLISGWTDKQFEIVALRELAASLDKQSLPRHTVIFTETPGRAGWRMTQGPEFLKD